METAADPENQNPLTPNGRPPKTRTAKLLLVFSSIGLGVLVFELLVRLLSPNMNLNVNWRYHPVLGWSQVPGAQYDYEPIPGKKIHVEFNSKGFRDVEHFLAKRSGTKRIVIIGDSFCESVQVNLEDTFFRRLEKMLNARSKYTWEVINLGVGDFGTTQEWIALESLGFSYSPDLVIHEIFPLNDICNNTLDLYTLCKSNNDGYRQYFEEANGQLVLTSAEPFRNFMRRHLISYDLMEAALHQRNKQQESEDQRALRLQALGFPRLDPLLYTYVSDEFQIDAVKKGWRLTELILSKIIYACNQRGIPYLGVVAPFQATVNSPDWQSFTSGQPLPRMTRDYPEHRLRNLFLRLSVPCITLHDVFERHPDLSLFLDGHFSEQGHTLAADAILQQMIVSRWTE